MTVPEEFIIFTNLFGTNKNLRKAFFKSFIFQVLKFCSLDTNESFQYLIIFLEQFSSKKKYKFWQINILEMLFPIYSISNIYFHSLTVHCGLVVSRTMKLKKSCFFNQTFSCKSLISNLWIRLWRSSQQKAFKKTESYLFSFFKFEFFWVSTNWNYN